MSAPLSAFLPLKADRVPGFEVGIYTEPWAEPPAPPWTGSWHPGKVESEGSWALLSL